jgi:hypothetical protein
VGRHPQLLIPTNPDFFLDFGAVPVFEHDAVALVLLWFG